MNNLTLQYCPGGRGKLFDDIQDDGESWSAVIDKANDWVQVGAGGECNLYSETGEFVFYSTLILYMSMMFAISYPNMPHSNVAYAHGPSRNGTSKLGYDWRQ